MSKRPANRKQRKEKGQSSQSSLPYPPALALTPDQEIRKAFLEQRRKLEPSRWICTETLQELGLTNSVQMLTERLGLWDFLCDEVQTYRNLTIEFLSSYEFDRGQRILSFNLGGYSHSMNATELMTILGLSAENAAQMRTITDFFHDLNENQFRSLTCEDGIINQQRVKNILHPTIRYIQRVISHTLFARGETASVFNEKDMFYVCCMLRRNNGEMEYMPHIGYNLAKHLRVVAINRQAGGTIRVGGIITKIAMALRVPTGYDIIEGYPTTVDIAGLQRARLISWDDIHECWVNLGPGTLRHRLPLQIDLDPMNQATWRPVDDPLEEQQIPAQQPPIQAEQPPAGAQPQEGQGPTNQQLWNYMVSMQTILTDQMRDMRVHFDKRLDDIEGEISTGRYYARTAAMHNNPDFEDDPPTPPHTRRAAQQIEEERARAQEAAREAAAAAAQQEDDLNQTDDDMDADT